MSALGIRPAPPLSMAMGPVKSVRKGAGIEALADTWPARLAQALIGGVTLPGDVYAGRVNPNSDEAVGRAADLAGMLTLGGGMVPMEANSLRAGIGRPPVSLPMDEASRLARAKQAGFDVDTRLYHGSPTMKEEGAFDLSHPPRTDTGYLGSGVYFTPQEWIAAEYAKPLGSAQKGTVLDAVVKKGKFKDFIYDENYVQTLEAEARRLGVTDKFNTPGWAKNFGDALRREGYDGARGVSADGHVSEVVVYDPRNIRSRNAAFDPAKSSIPDILAAGGQGGKVAGGLEAAAQANRPAMSIPPEPPVMGIRAYHGSPHDLPMDDASRMARADALGFRRNMPISYGTAPEGEKIASAAIDIDGRIFTGANHYEAIVAAEKELGIPFNKMNVGNIPDGFITTGGRYVSRREASDIASRERQSGKHTGRFEPFEAFSGLASEDTHLAGAAATPSTAVRTGATAPGLPGGHGIWGAVLPAEGAQGTALWHRAERPASLEAAGVNDHDLQATLAQAWLNGFDAIKLKNYTRPGSKTPEDIIVVRDANQIRSPDAAFDPTKRNSRDLMASIAGLTALGGAGALASSGGKAEAAPR